MNAEEFRAKVENGEVPVDSHDKMLRIAFIYMDDGLWIGDNGVFDVVKKLHARGWSFGQGNLKYNRTLDIFYLAQVAAGTYRSTDQLESDDFPSADDFDACYARHHDLLNRDAWREYYSERFLSQARSARFYHLPDLLDLPDSSDPLGQPRPQKGAGHFTKLPRWARNVQRTRARQPTLPPATMTQIALDTLKQSIIPLRKNYPSVVQPYSETQARFWLQHMDPPSLSLPARKWAWSPNKFGIDIAQGATDVWAWEAYYSRKLWDGSVDAPLVEPDLDGTRKSDVVWCGWPDGGCGAQAWMRGWDPELGSEEEIEFLAAVAVKETEGITEDMSNLDYAMRSHMLLGLTRAALFEADSDERGKHEEDLKRRIVEAGRIDEENKAEQWIQQVLMVMEPYVQKWNHVWPATAEDRGELLRLILVENGQLFARWRLSPHSEEFNFELNPPKGVE